MDATLITGEPTPQELTKLQQDVWERLREALDPKSVKVHVRSAFGDPAFELVRLADESGADLIVAGAHQRHGLQRLAAPSFSRSVLHHAAANVLCVPACSYKPEFHVPAVRRVLVATDLSPAGDGAIAHGCSVLASGGSLQILHVAPPPKSGLDPLVAARVYFSHSLDSSEANEALEEALLARIPRQFSTAGIAITSRVVEHDDVAAAICESAEKFGADIICMASRGHSPLVSAIIGSVAQGVLGRSHRPVLVVPPPVA
jgi:nucleotide-binding universal stress UspA family protein